MLISFTVGNFLSFKEKRTFSMEATSIKELPDSVVVSGKYRLLRTAAVYGANSSGKSNFIAAINTFKGVIHQSSRMNSTDKFDVVPFLLCPETKEKPSFFEIEMLIDSTYYRYGFEVTETLVVGEWFYRKKENERIEKCLFVRNKDGIGITELFKEGKGLEDKTRDNALFLSVADSFNGTISKDFMKHTIKMFAISGIKHEHWSDTVKIMYGINESNKELIDNFIRSLDLGFDGFEFTDDTDEELANDIKAYTVHPLYDDEGNVVGKTKFKLGHQESSGTNKLFDLSALIVKVLEWGEVLIVDELDSKLHPLLTRKIIEMFNSPDKNPKGAQLIFTTHDTNLLDKKLLRRDQIWFTEKDKCEATDLYSLVEFREPDGTKIRNDRSYEKDYINGRYGAIPYINK